MFTSVWSAPNGAVNRGFGSSGAIETIALSDAALPSATPQFVVIWRVRYTYSPTVRQPLFGSAS